MLQSDPPRTFLGRPRKSSFPSKILVEILGDPKESLRNPSNFDFLGFTRILLAWHPSMEFGVPSMASEHVS